MKHSKIKLIMTLCLLVLGLGQANAQSVKINHNYSNGYQVSWNHYYVAFSNLNQDIYGSDWGPSKYGTNSQAPSDKTLSGSNQLAYQRQSFGTDAADLFDRFTLTYTAPAYESVDYKLYYWIGITVNAGTSCRVAYFDYGTNYSAWNAGISTLKSPSGDANLSGAYYETTNRLRGETNCVASLSSEGSKSMTYALYVTVDNNNGSSQKTENRYGAFSSAKNITSSQIWHTTWMNMWYESTRHYWKHFTYYPNGATSSSANQLQSIKDNGSIKPASTFTRKNHIFTGWWTATTGGTKYDAGSAFTVNATNKGTMNLYAQWTPVQFTFKNGNATVGSQLSAQSNNSLPSLSAGTYKPTNGDKLFVGYFTEPEGRGIQVYDGSLQPTTAGNAESFDTNTTLYAYFIPTQHNVIFDYSFRTGESTYATLSTKIYTYRLQFKDAHGNALKTVDLTAPEATTRETASMTDAIDTHTTSNMLVTLKVKEGSESDILSGENPTIYFDTQADLERVHSFQYDVWNTTEPASKAEHWETETNEDTNTTIFKYTGYHEGNMFTLSWTVTLHDLAMYPEKIYAKPMVKNDGGTFVQISPMNGVTGLECLRTDDGSDKSIATYTGEYAVLKTQSAGTAEYKVGMTGFYLDGSDYFLNSTHGTVPDDFVSSTSATFENASISYDIYDYDIPVVLLVAGASDAKVNHQDRELYVDQARETHVNLSQFVAERLHFDFLGWYDTEWKVDGVNKVWSKDEEYYFYTHNQNGGGTRTLIAQWKRDSKPEASVEMTEEANSFDYTITATDAVEVKAVKYMTADEEPAADNTNWVVVEKNNDKYVVSINRENDKYGKYLYVMVENEGQYVIEKYEDPIRSFIDIKANPDPDSAIENGGSYTYYSTYYNSTQAFKPVNATAYKVIAVNENTLRLANITTTENDGISTAAEEGNDDFIAPQGELILPKGEAVILQGATPEITLELVGSTVARSTDNRLEGVDESTNQNGNNNYYKLTYAQNGLGFYLMGEDEQLAAHKAFVKTDNTSVNAFIMNFGEGGDPIVEAIREIEATDNADTTFDLSGRKVAPNQRGLYITNGKKVLK